MDICQLIYNTRLLIRQEWILAFYIMQCQKSIGFLHQIISMSKLLPTKSLCWSSRRCYFGLFTCLIITLKRLWRYQKFIWQALLLRNSQDQPSHYVGAQGYAIWIGLSVIIILETCQGLHKFICQVVLLENCFRVVNVCPVLEIPFLEFCYSVLFSCF